MELKTKKREGIIYLKGHDKILVNDTKNDTYRFLSLIDLEGYNNGDIFEIGSGYYCLFGDYLYCLNNRKTIKADIKLVNKIKSKISPLEYIKGRDYLYLDNPVFKNNDLLRALLLISYQKVVINDALKIRDFSGNRTFLLSNDNAEIDNYSLKELLSKRKYDDALGISFKTNDWVGSLDDDGCMCYKKGEFVDKDTIDLDETLTLLDKELDKKRFVNDESYQIYDSNNAAIDMKRKQYDTLKTFDEIYDELLEDAVGVQLWAGISVLKDYMYNYSLDGNEKENSYKDYTFLIVNFVKAVELLLIRKLSKLSGTIYLHNPKPGEYRLDSELFKNYAMLGDLINHIDDNPNKCIKDGLSTKYFIKSCRDFKNLARNQHFHKDCVDSFADADKIIVNSLKMLIRIEIYLK